MINWKEIVKKFTPDRYEGRKLRFRLLTDEERVARWDEVVYPLRRINRHYDGQPQLCIFIYKKVCKPPYGKIMGGYVEDIITVYLDVVFKEHPELLNK